MCRLERELVRQALRVCAVLTMILFGVAAPPVWACTGCVASGDSECCSIRTLWLYGSECPPGVQTAGDDSYDQFDRQDFVLSDPEEDQSGQYYEVELQWGKGVPADGTTKAVDFKRCFRKTKTGVPSR